jgi:hypothetical protein
VRSTVSPSLERFLMKALAKVPADRYPDATAFLTALQKSDVGEHTEVWSPPWPTLASGQGGGIATTCVPSGGH